MFSNESLLKRLLPAKLPGAFSGKLAQRFAMLAGATVIGQAAMLLAAPLLTRLYSPGDFGALGVFAGLFAVFSVFVSFKYEQAIPLAETDADAANLFVLTLLVAFVQCGILLALACLLVPLAPETWLPAAVISHLWLLVPALFGSALYLAATYWMIRDKNFPLIARAKVEQSVAQTGLEVAAGALGWQPLGLFLGFVVGKAGGAGLMLRRLWASKRQLLDSVSLTRVAELARANANFPLYVTPSLACNALAWAMPLLLLPITCGPAEAGVFLVTQRLILGPMALVGQSVSQVFYSELASNRHDSPKNLQLFYRLTRKLGLLGLAGASALTTAPLWASALFGENWTLAGWTLVAFIPLFVSGLMASPLSHAHHLQNTQRLFLGIEAARLLLTAGSFGAGYWWNLSLLTTIAIYSLALSLIYLAHWLAVRWILRRTIPPPLIASASGTPTDCSPPLSEEIGDRHVQL